MESEQHKYLYEQLMFFIELLKDPNLSSGARAVLNLSIAETQEKLLKLTPR